MAPTLPPTPPAQPGGGMPGTPPPGSPGTGSGRSPHPRASTPPDHPPGHPPPGERSDVFPAAGGRAPAGERPSDAIDPAAGTPTPGDDDEAGGDTPPGFDLLHSRPPPPAMRAPTLPHAPGGGDDAGAPDEGPEAGAAASPHPGLASPPGSSVSPTGSGSRDSWQAWATWGSLGMEFAAGIVVFFLLGSWADARWGTDPWLRLAGTFVGIVLGTYLLIKKALATTFTDRRDSTDRRGEPPRQGS